jgi:prevent-host-death family protein
MTYERNVRQLKANASEMLRRVREKRARYIIIYRGRPVALLAPLDVVSVDAETAAVGIGDAWQELVSLKPEIAKGWRGRRPSAELLSRMRR